MPLHVEVKDLLLRLSTANNFGVRNEAALLASVSSGPVYWKIDLRTASVDDAHKIFAKPQSTLRSMNGIRDVICGGDSGEIFTFVDETQWEEVKRVVLGRINSRT